MATYWENSCSFGLRYVSWYKYLIVSLVFSHLGFWSGNLFLIAPFPDLCLLVPLHSLMFHAKFNIHRPTGSEEDFFKIFVTYSHGGHLGHATMNFYANFHSLFLMMLHIKFGFDWQSGLREDVRIFWSYTCL